MVRSRCLNLPDKDFMSETDEIRERYERRKVGVASDRYSPLDEAVLRSIHERQLGVARWVRECCTKSLDSMRIIEVGCGNGANLLDLIRLGASPHNLYGNELLEERSIIAQRQLPSEVNFLPGDATTLEIKPCSFDVVLQSTVFSSILDDDFQHRLADSMWQWVNPGGGVLWYDFVYDNPKNPDVRGVRLSRVKELFPEAKITYWPITLAPPIARRIPASMYSWFNFRFLRTHILVWIEK